ncbi:EamA family transporter [Candidatus Paracaedibacter symbiosus]|uniref:EamA family transporter n=1 Tax=Candidatus Paracaedibacter symbiosus TaxID=244582 RepID=UPI00068B0244|nr:EamA family transporter [Candidatus Paracaedibacter symbiosus]
MRFQHILLAILVAAIWGFNFVVVKTGLNELPPFIYGAGRFVVAALPVLFLKKPQVSWKIIGGIGLTLGVLKFTLMFGGIYMGMSAGLASLVLQSQVFFTLALSTIFFKSKLRISQIVGMVIAFVGIVMIAWQTHAESSMIGFLMLIGSAMAWSVSNLLYQKAGKVDMFSLTVWTSLIPPLPMFIAAYFFEGGQAFEHAFLALSPTALSCLLFTGCASTLVGATLWGVLLRTYDATKVAPFSLLIPVFGISSAWLVLDEKLSGITIMACCLIFLGLVINQWHTKATLIKISKRASANAHASKAGLQEAA